jgi:uncharacterized membrane protein YbhN (UPF0104 family)
MARRLVLVGFVAATVAFLAIQFSNGVGRLTWDAVPSAGQLAAAAALLLAGQLLIGEALVALSAPVTGSNAVRRGFHVTQPSKYIPVGVAQGAGLTVVLRRAGMSTSAAITAWGLHTSSVVLSGVGLGLMVGGLDAWPIPLVALGAAVLCGYNRPLITTVLRQVPRLVRAAPSLETAVPDQARLCRCLAATGTGLILHGAAFALVINGSTTSVATAIAAYLTAHSLATATPLPGGLGAREALLLAFLASDDLTGVVLVRLLLMGIEAILALASIRRRI